MQAERKRYNPEIKIIFNPTAWATEESIFRWIRYQYQFSTVYSLRDQEPRLLSLDAFSAQMTDKVRQAFKDLNTTTSYIPGGCTGYIQVLDVAINKPFKDKIEEAAELHYDTYIEK